METKTPQSTNGYHHQRAPRTPESYFNVPESIALLNIVKSERIQSAFQSNRKNHASVWEMVAEVLNRFSSRKRTAKQCCNRYENLKKIYTQLKKNPERHVRRNWPYMFLFKEIEEQRGECWGSNGKRLALIAKNHNELSYYQRRRQAELSMLLNKNDSLTPQQHSLLQSLRHSTDSSQSGVSKLDRFIPNHFVETQLNDDPNNHNNGQQSNVGIYDNSPLQLQVAGAVAAAAVAAAAAAQKQHNLQMPNGVVVNGNNAGIDGGGGGSIGIGVGGGGGGGGGIGGIGGINETSTGDCVGDMGGGAVPPGLCLSVINAAHDISHNGLENGTIQKEQHALDGPPGVPDYDKTIGNDHDISMKSEPLSEGEFNPDDIQLMQSNYNGSQNYYSPNIDPNILHPDVIVDTDNLSDCSSPVSLKSKRKLSTSTDGDSTNYELIEYLKRREKRDEELLKRMDAREERLMNLLERTVIAIETLATNQLINKQPQTTATTTTCNNNAIAVKIPTTLTTITPPMASATASTTASLTNETTTMTTTTTNCIAPTLTSTEALSTTTTEAIQTETYSEAGAVTESETSANNNKDCRDNATVHSLVIDDDNVDDGKLSDITDSSNVPIIPNWTKRMN